MKNSVKQLLAIALVMTIATEGLEAQQNDSTQIKNYKNVVRYCLSGAVLFGFDKYAVFGYERVINKSQSVSLNVGKASFPKLVQITTDSFALTRDLKNTGVNVSIDYRFYLPGENKFLPPHGLYIGPYYSFNRFNRDNEFTFKRTGGTQELATSSTEFTINTIGAELGYQFILWKRLAIDMVLIGPGVSSYKLKANFSGNLSDADRQQLREAVQQIFTQKFPGMNYVLGDKTLDANGLINTWSVGFRYLVHIGFVF